MTVAVCLFLEKSQCGAGYGIGKTWAVSIGEDFSEDY